MTSLLNLHLEGNYFYGAIPDWFSKMTSLTFLDLSSNSFRTSLPISVCNLSGLAYLHLSFNHFQGSLPRCLGKLSALNVLHLHFNEFSGAIPSSLGQLTRLQKMRLSYNPLDGVPSESHFVKLTALKFLDISSTLLTWNNSPSRYGENNHDLVSHILQFSSQIKECFNCVAELDWMPVLKRYVLRLFISLKYITANVVDRNNGHIVVSASSVEHDLKKTLECGRFCNAKAAATVGEVLAMRLRVEGLEQAQGKGIHVDVSKEIEKKGFKNQTKVWAIVNALKNNGVKLVLDDDDNQDSPSCNR